MEQSTDHHKYKIRPRFKFISDLPANEIRNRIQQALEKPGADCIGMMQHNYAKIRIHEKDQHYWSPQLSITLDELDEGTEIRGLYGPRPVVWTMFVFFYSVIGFAIIVIAMLGLSYLTLDKQAGILWAVPLLLLVFLSLYLVSYSGQKMGKKQIKTLHDFVEKAIEQNIP